jgi:hypothetical protein
VKNNSILARKDLTRAVVHVEQESLSIHMGEWRFLVPDAYSPQIVTAFGDWIFTFPRLEIDFLDVLEWTFSCIADSETPFYHLLETVENRNRWFMADWVDICYGQGLVPKEGECFGWKIHPIFGCKLESANIQLFDILVFQSILGQIFRQIRSKPEGFMITEVRLEGEA